MHGFLPMTFSFILIVTISSCPAVESAYDDISGVVTFSTGGGNTASEVKLAAFFDDGASSPVLITNAVNLYTDPAPVYNFTLTFNFSSISNPQAGNTIDLCMWQDTDADDQFDSPGETLVSCKPDPVCPVFGTSTAATLIYTTSGWGIVINNSGGTSLFKYAVKTGAKITSSSDL